MLTNISAHLWLLKTITHDWLAPCSREDPHWKSKWGVSVDGSNASGRQYTRAGYFARLSVPAHLPAALLPGSDLELSQGHQTSHPFPIVLIRVMEITPRCLARRRIRKRRLHLRRLDAIIRQCLYVHPPSFFISVCNSVCVCVSVSVCVRQS